MEFSQADVRMLALFAVFWLALAHRSLGSEHIDELLRKHPTWSFEVESVETFINKALHEHSFGGQNLQEAEKDLREEVKRSLAPGATHIVRKIGDPKWETDPSKVPSFFDARERWPACAPQISFVEDEGDCYTDTPSVISSVLTDRYCIFTNGTWKERFSQEMLIGCAELCTGNSVQYFSWNYAKSQGLPTGGTHGSGKGCVPYTLPACDHTPWYKTEGLNRETVSPCQGIIFDHDCPKKCTNVKYKTPIDKDRVQPTTFYHMLKSEFYVRNEIMNYGPVMARVHLFDDFLEQPVGIWEEKPGRKRVGWLKYFKIIGWGTENGIKYWLCVHTWDTWGDKIFKFPRGENLDGVESLVSCAVFEDLD
ncbi:cathepsin B [Bemisia tabaci]|uniref:cathepsin B n=1 Tax=Bemisia tabaci TaxID=7038 RepID=UPI003B284EDF